MQSKHNLFFVFISKFCARRSLNYNCLLNLAHDAELSQLGNCWQVGDGSTCIVFSRSIILDDVDLIKGFSDMVSLPLSSVPSLRLTFPQCVVDANYDINNRYVLSVTTCSCGGFLRHLKYDSVLPLN